MNSNRKTGFDGLCLQQRNGRSHATTTTGHERTTTTTEFQRWNGWAHLQFAHEQDDERLAARPPRSFRHPTATSRSTAPQQHDDDERRCQQPPLRSRQQRCRAPTSDDSANFRTPVFSLFLFRDGRQQPAATTIDRAQSHPEDDGRRWRRCHRGRSDDDDVRHDGKSSRGPFIQRKRFDIQEIRPLMKTFSNN